MHNKFVNKQKKLQANFFGATFNLEIFLKKISFGQLKQLITVEAVSSVACDWHFAIILIFKERIKCLAFS